jgi:hypothetical protein
MATWTHTRGHVRDAETNTGSAASLDMYAALGDDAMSRSYQRLYPLRPRYGSPLSSEVQQIFVEEAPASSKDYIAAKVANILF